MGRFSKELLALAWPILDKMVLDCCMFWLVCRFLYKRPVLALPVCIELAEWAHYIGMASFGFAYSWYYGLKTAAYSSYLVHSDRSGWL